MKVYGSDKYNLFKIKASEQELNSMSSEFLNEYKQECKLKPIRETENFFEADSLTDFQMLFT